jgi:6-methylsalicylate decarboxylase
MPPFEKIDVHSHYCPDFYRQACIENGHKNPDGMPGVPQWSEDYHLEMMTKINASKCIISISSPGVHLVANDDELGRKLARQCNEFAADLKRRRPEQFGFFASMPAPDVEGCLAEIKHCFDNLNCDGVTFKTNHHGVYMGDKRLDAVFDELNRRKAVVFIHPTQPCMADGTLAVPVQLFPRSTYEFFFDTCRAVINLFATGIVSRCPNITFIIPHLGGAFPPLINRFSRVGPILGLPGIDPELSADMVKEKLNTQFYFDTAGWAFTEQIKALLEYVKVDRILYGSDFPWTPLAPVMTLSEEHDKYLPVVFPNREDQEKLAKKNAIRMLTRHKL